GIATVTTLLVRRAQIHQNYLVAHLTADAQAVGGAVAGLVGHLSTYGYDSSTAHHAALVAIYRMVGQQASLMAYSDNFAVLGYLSLVSIPVVLFFQRVERH